MIIIKLKDVIMTFCACNINNDDLIIGEINKDRC